MSQSTEAAVEKQPVSAYQQRIMQDYPLERHLPPNSDDPDILFNHIMKISFLSGKDVLQRQNVLQEAEQYALQQCQLQCKRDGRMKRDKTADSAGDDKEIKMKQLMEKIEKDIEDGKLSDEEVRKFRQAQKFQEELESIPWVESDETDQQVDAEAPTVDNEADTSSEQKPFLAEPLFASHGGRLSEAEEVELRYEEEKRRKAENDSTTIAAPRTTKKSTIELLSTDDQRADDNAKKLRPEDLAPAVPQDARQIAPTAEQLALDPDNPEVVLQPVKDRVNRFTYASEFKDFDDVANLTEEQIKQKLHDKRASQTPQYDDDNVAGLVADGSVVPVQNEGAHARADLPPVYRDGPGHREKVMREEYDPARDKPFLWDKNFKYIVVSMIGPDCPQKAPRRMFRVWGGVRNKRQADKLMQAVLKKNPYGYLWRTYCFSIQRWIGFIPPRVKDNDTGSVAEGNNEFAEYLQANVDHQKHATVELEQRALDAKASAKTEGQTLIEQLKEKNMNVEGGVSADMIPRSQ